VLHHGVALYIPLSGLVQQDVARNCIVQTYIAHWYIVRYHTVHLLGNELVEDKLVRAARALVPDTLDWDEETQKPKGLHLDIGHHNFAQDILGPDTAGIHQYGGLDREVLGIRQIALELEELVQKALSVELCTGRYIEEGHNS
jgi:hypothetical protein